MNTNYEQETKPLVDLFDELKKSEYSTHTDKVINKNPSLSDAVDMVNKPPHYNRDGAVECIEEMIFAFGPFAVKHYCVCNAWKYRYRAGSKGKYEEDMAKSDWYMKKAFEIDRQQKMERDEFYKRKE